MIEKINSITSFEKFKFYLMKEIVEREKNCFIDSAPYDSH